MNILLIARNHQDLVRHQYFRQRISEQYSDARIYIVCCERDSKLQNAEDVVYPLATLPEYLRQYRSASPAEILQLQARMVTSQSLYKSDGRFVNGFTTERDLFLEQSLLEENVKQLFMRVPFDLCFLIEGGNLVRNVPVQLCEHFNVKYYLILPCMHLNPHRTGLRYWFNSNLYCRLSPHATDQFPHNPHSVQKHARHYIEMLTSKTYKLDYFARNVAKVRRVSAGFFGVIKDVWQGLSFSRRSGFHLPPKLRLRVRSYIRSVRNRKLATRFEDIDRPTFVFTLNVADDAQLVLRSPQSRDLFSTCQQVANLLPYNSILAVKEHPGHPGMLNHQKLKHFLQHNPNVRFLDSSSDLMTILKKSAALVTLNSTAAIEALLERVPVIILGEAFYKGQGLTADVEYMLDLPQVLSKALTGRQRIPEVAEIERVIQRLLLETYPEPNVFNQKPEDSFEIIANGMIARIEALRLHAQPSVVQTQKRFTRKMEVKMKDILNSQLFTRIKRKYSRLMATRQKPPFKMEEVHYIADYCRQNGLHSGVMLDVGAHRGSACKKFLELGWQVFALEPDTKNRALLKTALGHYPTLKIDNFAVTEKSGDVLEFYRSELSSGISTLSPFHSSHYVSEKVETVTLKDYLKRCNLGHVDFLKIDTEGFDLFVLRSNDWKAMQPSIVICEYENAKTVKLGYNYFDVAEYLRAQGYEVFASEWYPIVQYGGKHQWKKFTQDLKSIDSKSWGNLIAAKPEVFPQLQKHMMKLAKRKARIG